MIKKIPVSVQDRYLVVDSPFPWTLHFNDGKKLEYYSGRYIADLYAPLGSGGHGDEAIRNVFIEYDDHNEAEDKFTWQTSEIPIVELTGVNGQIVQLANFPEVLKVDVKDSFESVHSSFFNDLKFVDFSLSRRVLVHSLLSGFRDFFVDKFGSVEGTNLNCLIFDGIIIDIRNGDSAYPELKCFYVGRSVLHFNGAGFLFFAVRDGYLRSFKYADGLEEDPVKVLFRADYEGGDGVSDLYMKGRFYCLPALSGDGDYFYGFPDGVVDPADPYDPDRVPDGVVDPADPYDPDRDE